MVRTYLSQLCFSGPIEGAFRDWHLRRVGLRQDHSSQQDYQGAGCSLGHPPLHGLLLQSPQPGVVTIKFHRMTSIKSRPFPYS